MIKKMLDKYAITITGTMVAVTSIKLIMSAGLYLAYKNFYLKKEVKTTEVPKPVMIEYAKSGARTFLEFAAFFALVQGFSAICPTIAATVGGTLNYFGFARTNGIISNFTRVLVYGLLFGGSSILGAFYYKERYRLLMQWN